MAYDTHWQRMERWKVTYATGMGTTLDKYDFLRFEGNAGNGKLIRKDHNTGVESEWGFNCQHIPGPTETMNVDTLTLGKFLITHTPGSHGCPPTADTPAKLTCKGVGPITGAEWTAVEQLPPLP